MEDENLADRERFSSIGITESPMKGRRIKLFQETSEESFEESLMAGGYGRYVSDLDLFSSTRCINHILAHGRMGPSASTDRCQCRDRSTSQRRCTS